MYEEAVKGALKLKGTADGGVKKWAHFYSRNDSASCMYVRVCVKDGERCARRYIPERSKT